MRREIQKKEYDICYILSIRRKKRTSAKETRHMRRDKRPHCLLIMCIGNIYHIHARKSKHIIKRQCAGEKTYTKDLCMYAHDVYYM